MASTTMDIIRQVGDTNEEYAASIKVDRDRSRREKSKKPKNRLPCQDRNALHYNLIIKFLPNLCLD